MIGLEEKEYLKLAIFWAGYFYFPAALFLGYLIARRRGAPRMLATLMFAGLSVLAYARFIEPRILLTVEHETTLARCLPQAGGARLAVFSDTHNGLFGNAMPIDRIVHSVNKARPDIVMIAGDFTYFLAPSRFSKTFSALDALDAPAFAVMGNHDVGLPGPDVGAPLTKSLSEIGVTVLSDRMTAIDVGSARLEVVGLSDLWEDRQNLALLEKRGDAPRLILTHNATTIKTLLPRQSVDLMISGHTHGGQINIPYVTCALVPFACRPARYGFLETKRGMVFITSGTGMVALPMRFNAPPRIDVLNVSWRACGSGA